MEIAQGISKNICNDCSAGKEKGRQKTGKPEQLPKSHIAKFLGGQGLDE